MKSYCTVCGEESVSSRTVEIGEHEGEKLYQVFATCKNGHEYRVAKDGIYPVLYNQTERGDGACRWCGGPE